MIVLEEIKAWILRCKFEITDSSSIIFSDSFSSVLILTLLISTTLLNIIKASDFGILSWIYSLNWFQQYSKSWMKRGKCINLYGIDRRSQFSIKSHNPADKVWFTESKSIPDTEPPGTSPQEFHLQWSVWRFVARSVRCWETRLITASDLFLIGIRTTSYRRIELSGIELIYSKSQGSLSTSKSEMPSILDS